MGLLHLLAHFGKSGAVLWTLLIWNVVVYATFFGLYNAVGFSKHFNVPAKGSTVGNVAYFTIATHVMLGHTDTYPRTALGRALVSCHLLCVWIPMVVLLHKR